MIISRVLRFRSLFAKASNGSVDELRVRFTKLFTSKVQAPHNPIAIIMHQHISVSSQTLKQVLTFRIFEINRQPALTAITIGEEC